MMLLLNEDERCFYISMNKKIVFTRSETEIISFLMTHKYSKPFELSKYVYRIEDGIIYNRNNSLSASISRINKKYSKVLNIKKDYHNGYYLKWNISFNSVRIKNKKDKIKLIEEESKLIRLKKEIVKIEKNIKTLEKKIKI